MTRSASDRPAKHFTDKVKRPKPLFAHLATNPPAQLSSSPLRTPNGMTRPVAACAAAQDPALLEGVLVFCRAEYWLATRSAS